MECVCQGLEAHGTISVADKHTHTHNPNCITTYIIVYKPYSIIYLKNTVVSAYSLDGAIFSANGAVGGETGEELELVGRGVVPVTAQEPHVDSSVIGCPPESIVHYWPVPGAIHTYIIHTVAGVVST